MAVDVGSVQHAARPVLSQRSVNVLHVNKSPSASDHKVGDAKTHRQTQCQYGFLIFF